MGYGSMEYKLKFKKYINLMKTYKGYIKEQALDKKDIQRFYNLSKITDKKKLLKSINKDILKIKTLLENIPLDKIKLIKIDKYNGRTTYKISWDSKTNNYITRLNNILYDTDDEDIQDKLENIDNLEIDIDGKLFNRIHFPNSLPSYLKNIGLGKKIYLKAIEKFDYISTLIDGVDSASFEAKMVWDFLINSDDVYTVSKDNLSILAINKNYKDFKILILDYLKDAEEYIIDKKLKNVFEI